MPSRRKVWMYSPPKLPKPSVPEALKVEVKRQADGLVDSVLKPKHVLPPPDDMRFNYIVDIYTRWYRNYFYFCSKYRCPAPNCLSEFFEAKFARLEYVGDSSFNLAFMRHTGQWFEIEQELPFDSCLRKIINDSFFQP